MNTSIQSEIMKAYHRYTNSFTTTGENVYYPTLTKDSQHESKQFKSNTLKQENLAFARFFTYLNLVAKAGIEPATHGFSVQLTTRILLVLFVS